MPSGSRSSTAPRRLRRGRSRSIPRRLQDDDGPNLFVFRLPSAEGCEAPSLPYRALAGELHTVAFLNAQGKPVPLAAPGKDPVLPKATAKPLFVFKRAASTISCIPMAGRQTATQVYAVGDHPMGPFTYARQGDWSTPRASTQHGSVVQFKGKWYVLYHTSELSNGNSFRARCALTSLTFDGDGRINTVTPTKERPPGPQPPARVPSKEDRACSSNHPKTHQVPGREGTVEDHRKWISRHRHLVIGRGLWEHRALNWERCRDSRANVRE